MLIWNELSFEVEEFGAEYTKKRHLYNRKTKKTYTGLISYVIKIFDDLGEDYEINTSDGYVYVSTEKESFAYRITQISGSIKKGVNKIIKQNGMVILSD